MNPDALSFNTLVSTLEEGQLHADLTRQLQEIVATLNNQVMEHGGSPTAALGLALTFKLENGAIDIHAEIKAKLPKEPRPRTICWTTPDNQLTRKNPKQQELPFRDVNVKGETMRDVM